MSTANQQKQKVTQSTLTAFTILIIVMGCSDDSHNHPELVTGEQLFNHHCAGCHKETGAGSFLQGVPPTRDTYLSSLQIAHKVTSSEENGSKMPNFSNMSDAEAQKIASYVKTL